MMNYETARKHPVYSEIPVQTLDALYDYIDNHAPVGGFLLAVLCNDLFSATAAGTGEDNAALPSLVTFIRAEAPLCWGSSQRVTNWLMFKPV